MPLTRLFDYLGKRMLLLNLPSGSTGVPTLQDLTGATGTGPHALSGSPTVALVYVRAQPLRRVASAPNAVQYTLSAGNITLGRALLATDDFWVLWW